MPSCWNKDLNPVIVCQDCFSTTERGRGCTQELLDATHHILGELEKEHKAHMAPGGSADALKPDADADELREKFRIVRVSGVEPLRCRCICFDPANTLVSLLWHHTDGLRGGTLFG